MIDAPLDVAVGMPMAMTLGLAYGLGPCLIACLPTLGAVFLAHDCGWRRSWRIILPLSLGRLTAYAGLGALAGWAGQALGGETAAPLLSLVVGAAMVMIGVALAWPRRAVCAGIAQPLRRRDRSDMPRPLLPGGLYLAGVGMALTPCAAFGAILFSAAARGHAFGGALLGLGFGVGAILIPSLAYGVGMAWMGGRLRAQLGQARPVIERLAAGLLIVAGAGQLLRSF